MQILFDVSIFLLELEAMKSLLVFNVFLLVCCQLQFVLSAEWSQLQAYLKQFPYSNEHKTTFLNNTSGCIQSFIAKRESRGSPPRKCRKATLDYIHEISFAEPLEPSCAYNLQKISSILFRKSNIVVIKVAIIQDSCTNGVLSEKGGSSLRVQLANAHNKVDCRLHHIQRDEYTYTCRLRISNQPSDLSNQKCNFLCGLSVRAILDYENFGAYHERAGVGYGQGRLVVDETVADIPLHPPQHNSAVNTKSAPSVCCLLRALPVYVGNVGSSNRNNSRGDRHSTSTTSTTSTSIIGADDGSLNPDNTSDVQDRLAAQYAAVYFIGSSHMRYLWDVLVQRHLNGSALLQSLPQHHSDTAMGNTWFLNNYFSMELPSLVEEICSPDSVYAPNTAAQGYDVRKKLAFVIETGSWDLDYNPVRSLVEYPPSSSEVVGLIHKLAAEGNTCMGHATSVIWVTAPPVPECSPATTTTTTATGTTAVEAAVEVRSHRGVVYTEKTSCFDKGYRNNYALAAANQHFLQAITGVPHLPSITSSSSSSGGIRTQTAQTGNSLYSRIWKRLSGKNRNSQQSMTAAVSGSLGNTSESIPPLSRNPQLRVLDAFSLLYPHRQTHVCGMHYLCCKRAPSDKSLDVLVTPGGELLVQQLLLSLLAAK